MSVHTFHLPSLDAGLCDECPRCEEHAARPFDSLDPEHLRAFVIYARKVRAGQAEWRSKADAQVGRTLLRAVDQARRLRELDLLG